MKLQLAKASTDVTIEIWIADSSSTTGAGLTGLVWNSAGLASYYARPLAVAAALTLATQTVTGAHSDGGFVEIDATNMPGWYRLDLSDAILATGVDSVGVHLEGATNMAPLPIEIQLTDLDMNTAMRGTDNAATAAVLGALADGAADGDPTAADTVMQYVKQLINVLVGTAGVVTYPGAAAPGNGVSLAEVLRSVYDDSNELQTDWVDAGRLDLIIDAILADTNELQSDDVPGLIAALNDLGTADIDARLAAIGLDHLVSAAVVGADVTDNSIVAKLASKSATADWDDFVNTTDSLQALRDDLALASVATEARLAELDAANLPADIDAILLGTGTTIPALLPAALVGGRMDSSVGAMAANVLTATAIATDAITAATIAADAIGASEIADGAIDAGAIAAAAANKIADHIWRRTLANSRASSDGDAVIFRSPLGAASKLVNRVAAPSSTLTVYQEDDATAFGTQVVTSDADADPITEVNTV